jgi:hypothetical protein
MGDMSRTRPGADLSKQLDTVRDDGGGRSVVIGGGTRVTRGDGGVRAGVAYGPGLSKPTPAPSGPAGRISVADKNALDATSLTAEAVLAKIQSAYFAGLKRCYKTFLTKDPSARGTVTLGFTVDQTGRLVNPTATGFAGEVDTCFASMMRGWRFPVPKDADGEPIDATFTIQLSLVPD